MKSTIRPKTGTRAGGFTLVEVTFSIVIVGVAIVSLMMLFAAGTTVNSFGNKLSSAVFLADQLRSMTDQTGFDDIINDGDQTFNGVDAEGNSIPGLGNFQQDLTIQPINPEDMTVYVGPDPTAAILTASVSGTEGQLLQISWLRVK